MCVIERIEIEIEGEREGEKESERGGRERNREKGRERDLEFLGTVPRVKLLISTQLKHSQNHNE